MAHQNAFDTARTFSVMDSPPVVLAGLTAKVDRSSHKELKNR
jgi:hypothetical protein